MGCLIELILRRQEQQFPSHRISGFSIETIRERTPIFMMGSSTPRAYAAGNSYTELTLNLRSLSLDEFNFINNKINNREIVGPIMIRNYEAGKTLEVYGTINSGSGKPDGSATVDIGVTQINVVQRGETQWRAS